MPFARIAVEDLARMSPTDRQLYITGAPGEVQRQIAADLRQAADLANQTFLGVTVPKYAPCTALGSSSPTAANYSQGGTLTFNIPNQNGGYLEGIFLIFDLTFTYTPAGSGPTVALNAAAPFSAIENVTMRYGANNLDYGNLYFYSLIDGRSRGYLKQDGTVLLSAANQVSSIRTALRNGLTLNSGANTWRFTAFIDRNPLNDQSPAGMVPIGGGQAASITLRAPALFAGPDPLLNVISTNGTISSVGGTVQAFAMYRDGVSLASTRPYQGPDMSSEPTYQTVLEPTTRLQVSGAYNTGRISTVGKHYYVYSVVIDGAQSDRFSTYANLTGFRMGYDEAGQNLIYSFGSPGLVPRELWFWQIARTFGQDFPEGVIPWVNAPAMNETDPDDRLGRAILNMDAGDPYAFTSLYQQYQLTAVTSANGINPRVETFVGTVRSPGLAVMG